MNRSVETGVVARRVSELMSFTQTSNQELARICGVTPNAISQKRNGQRSFRTSELVLAMRLFKEKGVQVDIDFLIGLPDAQRPRYIPKENALVQVGA